MKRNETDIIIKRKSKGSKRISTVSMGQGATADSF